MSDVLGGPCPWLLLTLTLADLLTHTSDIRTTQRRVPTFTPISRFFLIRLTCAFALRPGNEVKYDSGVLSVGMEPLTGLNLNEEFKKDINNKADTIFQDVFKTGFGK